MTSSIWSYDKKLQLRKPALQKRRRHLLAHADSARFSGAPGSAFFKTAMLRDEIVYVRTEYSRLAMRSTQLYLQLMATSDHSMIMSTAQYGSESGSMQELTPDVMLCLAQTWLSLSPSVSRKESLSAFQTYLARISSTLLRCKHMVQPFNMAMPPVSENSKLRAVFNRNSAAVAASHDPHKAPSLGLQNFTAEDYGQAGLTDKISKDWTRHFRAWSPITAE